ncbi:RagB/SusD family nutrient uptake outer membrane protein [Belliella marina]|uniref:RagB/SusD family nutrient uptake outer membrane protein n=2 Tax=Belliella marina TaxID=1644146 RepID=A0ABW4VNA8_9BACT
MKMNRIITILLMLSLTACVDEFLDRRMDTNYTKDQVFSTYTTIRNFGIGIYSHLPNGFDRFDGGTLAAASDEAVHSGAIGTVQKLSSGNWGAFSNPDDQWNNLYSGIRKANLFLQESVDYERVIIQDTITDQGRQTYQTQVNDLRWLRAEAHFLKAYFYFELIKRYGGVPIIEEVLTLEDTQGIQRASFGECVNFIENEIQTALVDLRVSWQGFDSDRLLGRATTGAAHALRSRLWLYAASPLHNTGADPEPWEKAAVASFEVIGSGQYNLVGNYRDLFRSSHNSEIIFSRRYPAANSLERSMYPIGFTGAVGGTNPSQNLVNAYETSNGLAISEDPTYDPQAPYVNRDPRLMMSIVTNGSTYKGRAVETFRYGMDGPGKPRATRTGYYQKKYVDEGLDILQGRTSVHAWIYFRYAEVLLNYAEAMNELYGPDGTSEQTPLSAREALNQVRTRPGVNMPAVAVQGKDAFRDRLHNERRVELAFEEHRYWDVRRWGIADEVLNQPILGVSIALNSGGDIEYNEREVESRYFAPHMNLYPIQAVEINKSGGTLTQNPGW